MHPRSTNRPTQAQLVFPLLETIDDLGSRARAKDVCHALADRFALPAGVRTETVTTADGQTVNVWQRHVRFARQKARQMGYLADDQDRLWSLSDEGTEGLRSAKAAVVVTIVTDAAGSPTGAHIDIGVGLPTVHTLRRGDARDLGWIPDDSIGLVLTSPPYFDAKAYESPDGQLARFPTYEAFLDQLDAVWRHAFRVLIPGGRFVCNVADVTRARKKHGSHHVLPLGADILVRSRRLGFQALNGIVWRKPTSCAYEQGPGGILGKPGQPGGIIKVETEHILLLRKPGGYRHPTPAQREASAISKEEYAAWFQPVWDIPGTRSATHPAPFPVEMPQRLIRMFSFAGDTVLDPFSGSGTTTIAAMRTGRNSIGVEIAPGYFRKSVERAAAEAHRLAAA